MCPSQLANAIASSGLGKSPLAFLWDDHSGGIFLLSRRAGALPLQNELWVDGLAGSH